MSITKFFTGGGIAAIAAALVITAVPAQAQDKRNWRAQREESGARQNSGRTVSEQRSWNRGSQQAQPQQQPQRSWTPPARQQRQQQAPQQQPQRSWNRGSQQQAPQGGPIAQQRAGRDWNNSDRAGRDWNRSDAQAQAQVRAQQQAQIEARARAERQQRDWNGNRDNRTVSRNGTYADRNRNQTYRRDTDRNWRDNDRSGQSYAYRDGRRDQRQWDRRWRDNNRYNWQSYRSANRSTYRLGSYYAPYRGYSYRRLSIGFFLDNLFYSNRYWINDPWSYRLPEVYGPYRWVRYYDDAMLVDVYSGEVVDVIYDFFW